MDRLVISDVPESMLEGKRVFVRVDFNVPIKNGKINATLPKSSDPETITLEEAVALVKAKAEKGGRKKARKRTKAKAGSKTKSATKQKSKTEKSTSSGTKSGPKSKAKKSKSKATSPE